MPLMWLILLVDSYTCVGLDIESFLYLVFLNYHFFLTNLFLFTERLKFFFSRRNRCVKI